MKTHVSVLRGNNNYNNNYNNDNNNNLEYDCGCDGISRVPLPVGHL